jgi:predicted DNA-binding transcriptional regulator AlpA
MRLFLNTAQLSEKLGMSKGSIAQMRQRDKSFPVPVKVSPRVLRWDESEIDEWLYARRDQDYGKNRRFG